MGLREDFLRRIEKKRAEIDVQRTNLRIEERYLEAMMDAYKLLPKTGDDSNGSSRPTGLRKGSAVGKAYDALKRLGRPAHISEIVEASGHKVTRTATQGLASSLRGYVNDGRIFTKPAPNTYGLIEFGSGDVLHAPTEEGN